MFILYLQAHSNRRHGSCTLESLMRGLLYLLVNLVMNSNTTLCYALLMHNTLPRGFLTWIGDKVSHFSFLALETTHSLLSLWIWMSSIFMALKASSPYCWMGLDWLIWVARCAFLGCFPRQLFFFFFLESSRVLLGWRFLLFTVFGCVLFQRSGFESFYGKDLEFFWDGSFWSSRCLDIYVIFL